MLISTVVGSATFQLKDSILLCVNQYDIIRSYKKEKNSWWPQGLSDANVITNRRLAWRKISRTPLIKLSQPKLSLQGKLETQNCWIAKCQGGRIYFRD